MTRIEGKVAAVLNERELVLNIGAADGVQVGMRFKILYPGGIEITDPDTSEPLGSVEWPKTEVKIVSTQAHMSVGRTFRTVYIPESGSPLYGGMSTLFGKKYEPAREAIETLRQGEGFAERELPASESVVKRGDPAVQVVPLPKAATDVASQEGY